MVESQAFRFSWRYSGEGLILLRVPNWEDENIEQTKVKKPVKMSQVVNWYHGNVCIRCARIDMESEAYGRKCYDKLQALGKGIGTPEITHKEFVNIAKSSPFCKPIKREFHECPACKALGVPQWRL